MGNSLFSSSSFDEIFRDMQTAFEPAFSQGSRGSYELVENGDDAILYVAVPGYTSDDISVEINAGKLSISGQAAKSGDVDLTTGTRLVPHKIDLKFSISSAYLVGSAEIANGLLRVNLSRQAGKTETVKIPVKPL